MTEEEMREAIETVEYLEQCKLERAVNTWFDSQVNPQLTEFISGLWDDPRWREVIESRDFESLPKLTLARAEASTRQDSC